MKIGYTRVSTKDRIFDVQIDALKKAGCKKLYKDVASGARSERLALNEMIANLRSGDVLVTWKLDRLGRSLNHLSGNRNAGKWGSDARVSIEGIPYDVDPELAGENVVLW